MTVIKKAYVVKSPLNPRRIDFDGPRFGVPMTATEASRLPMLPFRSSTPPSIVQDERLISLLANISSNVPKMVMNLMYLTINIEKEASNITVNIEPKTNDLRATIKETNSKKNMKRNKNRLNNRIGRSRTLRRSTNDLSATIEQTNSKKYKKRNKNHSDYRIGRSRTSRRSMNDSRATIKQTNSKKYKKRNKNHFDHRIGRSRTSRRSRTLRRSSNHQHQMLESSVKKYRSLKLRLWWFVPGIADSTPITKSIYF